MTDRPGRIAVLVNSDYDAELTAGTGADVSSVRLSAMAVATALEAKGYRVDVVPIEGPDLFEVFGRLRADRPDVIFNLCESLSGDPRNEPTIPALLDTFGIPYTGADTLALGLCLHKRRTKDLLIGAACRPRRSGSCAPRRISRRRGPGLDYPWFLKLAHEDASIGVEETNVVHDEAQFLARCRRMWSEFGQAVLAEKFVAGREVNVTFLGEGAGARDPAAPRDRLREDAGGPAAHHHVRRQVGREPRRLRGTKPVPLRDGDPALRARIAAAAKGAWDATGLRDYGRVDLRIDDAGMPWVIDVNPNPDISPDAGVARAAAVAGFDYPSLIEKVALSAWARRKK